MNDGGMLRLSVDVIKEIDKTRGRMSRSGFIRYLIHKHDVAQFEEQTYVTEEEFQEYQRGVKSLLRSFLDFVVTFGLELGKQPDQRGKLAPSSASAG